MPSRVGPHEPASRFTLSAESDQLEARLELDVLDAHARLALPLYSRWAVQGDTGVFTDSEPRDPATVKRSPADLARDPKPSEVDMPYLNCRSCRLTLYASSGSEPISACPRCGGRLGDPARLFRQVRKVQRSIRRSPRLPPSRGRTARP